MSWKDRVDEWGGGEVSFFSEDGEAMVFVIAADPVLLEGKFKGKPSERVGCPIVTVEGFTLLIIGKRLFRRLARYEKDFATKAFMVVRHGEHGDIDTTFGLNIVDDTELTERLFDIKKKEFKPALVKEAVSAAQDIVKG